MTVLDRRGVKVKAGELMRIADPLGGIRMHSIEHDDRALAELRDLMATHPDVADLAAGSAGFGSLRPARRAPVRVLLPVLASVAVVLVALITLAVTTGAPDRSGPLPHGRVAPGHSRPGTSGHAQPHSTATSASRVSTREAQRIAMQCARNVRHLLTEMVDATGRLPADSSVSHRRAVALAALRRAVPNAGSARYQRAADAYRLWVAAGSIATSRGIGAVVGRECIE